MIFSPELADLVRAGRKTVTRRPVKLVPNLQPDGWDGQRDGMAAVPCRYQPGKTYAVQPGRGEKGICRILVKSVEQQILSGLWTRPDRRQEAQREGFTDTCEFRNYWKRLYGEINGGMLVWRIEFELALEPVVAEAPAPVDQLALETAA